MAEVVRMPEVLAGAAEGAIQTWLVSVGSAVEAGQALAEIETDKAVVEFTAEKGGLVGRLLVAEGDSVQVGDPILVLLAEDDGDGAVDAALEEAGVAPTPAGEVADAPAATDADESERPAAASAVASAAHEEPSHRLFASPLVRKLAREAGVLLSDLTGTGPAGRIVRRDLEHHLSELARHPRAVATAAPAAECAPAAAASAEGSDFEDVPLDRMRRAIARRLTESKTTVPHFYLVADCRVDALLELRRSVNEAAPQKISVNDFVLKAVAGALMEVSASNAIWNGDSIRRFSDADIAVAVATENGLVTPVLRAVERMPLSEVSRAVADLAERGRTGQLKQHELEGGSFCVSNLGMYGTAEFTAILNPPQSGILAVGAARAMPVVSDGQLAVGQVMTVTLSADHRVLDGAVAAQWLAAFQRRIENPLSILI